MGAPPHQPRHSADSSTLARTGAGLQRTQNPWGAPPPVAARLPAADCCQPLQTALPALALGSHSRQPNGSQELARAIICIGLQQAPTGDGCQWAAPRTAGA